MRQRFIACTKLFILNHVHFCLAKILCLGDAGGKNSKEAINFGAGKGHAKRIRVSDT